MPPKADKTESKEAAAAKEAVDTAVGRLQSDATELERWRKPLLEAFGKVEKGLAELAKSQKAGKPLGKEIGTALKAQGKVT
jgi:hypothetical protein